MDENVVLARLATLLETIGWKGEVYVGGSRAGINSIFRSHHPSSDLDVFLPGSGLSQRQREELQLRLQVLAEGTGLDIGVESPTTMGNGIRDRSLVDITGLFRKSKES